MAIVTISRELAALGDETALKLKNILACRMVEKKHLEDRMKSFGVEERKISKYDERKPSFFAALSLDRDDYLCCLKSAVFFEAAQGNCIFVGRGCAALFRNIPGALSVFLAAPLEIRLERVRGYFHCDERRARQIIDQSDRDREGYHRYFFEMKWRGPENYHLALNTGLLHPELCAEMIKAVLEKTVTPENEAAGILRINDLVLGQQVVRHIRFERTLPVHFLETAVQSGTVTLFGVVNSPPLVEAAIQAAKEVPGVQSVISEIQIVQEYSVVP
jgi:hypothetical protein